MNFTIGNTDFSFKENAYKSIETYISEIRRYFKSQDDENSITDIEFAISDKFEKILEERTDKTLVLGDVEKIILELGSVELITDEEVISQEETHLVVGKKLYRDSNDIVIAGVCSGLGHYFGVNSWLIRILFIASIFTPFPTIIIYILLWFLFPITRTKADELRMKGIPVSLSSLSKDSEDFTEKRAKSLLKAVIILFITFILFIISVIIIVVTLGVINSDHSDQIDTNIKTEKVIEIN